MKPYRITWRESSDDEPQSTVFHGFDAEHAEERFLDSFESEGGSAGVIIESIRLA